VARALQFNACVKLLRAGAAGIFATAIDLLVLAVLVTGFHLSPQIANVPALVAGGVANFAGNRWFAFRAQGGSLPKQALGYTVVELVALALNGWLFALVMHVFPHAPYWAVRLATTNVVFLAWSYPLWTLVFRQRGGRPALSSS
jgi:putative flippase GtrA